MIHHRKAFPDDPHLRLWSGLIAEAAGRRELAAGEFAHAGVPGSPTAAPPPTARVRLRCVGGDTERFEHFWD